MSRSGDVDESAICLRRYGPDDLPLLIALLGDPGAMRHLGGPESDDLIRSRHERYLRMPDDEGALRVIERGSERQPIGWVGYWRAQVDGEEAWECGWHVLGRHQGVGVAGTAMRRLIVDLRSRGETGSLHAFPAVGNVSSNALADSLGFSAVDERDVEYPKGSMLHVRHWRLDLTPSTRRSIMERSVADKARVKPGTAVAVVGDDHGVVGALGLLPDTPRTTVAEAAIVMLFPVDRADLDTSVPAVAGSMAPGAAMWVFFRKGGRAAGRDVGRDEVWSRAEAEGMRPLGLLSVDDTWSVFRLKPGQGAQS